MSGTRDQGNILGTMPVDRLVLTMSAPIMISMLVSAVYNLVDSIYVAQVSDLDFLALSYAYPVQLMMVAFCTGIGVGFNATFAQRLGEGKGEEANRVACHGFLFYTLCWLLFLAFALFGAPLFFRLSTDDPVVARAGVEYLTICCGASIGMCMQFLTERLLQTTGHPAGFMIVQGSGAVLNIVLDPVFIFLFDMGIQGAALATVIAQGCSAVWVMKFLTGRRAILRLRLEYLRLSAARVRKIIALGLSGFFMNLTNSLVQIVCNATLQSYGGDLYVGVMTIINSLREVFTMPVQGLSNGSQPVTSYNYGAGQYSRVCASIRFTMGVAVACTAVFWAAAMLFPGPLIQIFSREPDVVAAGIPALRIYFCMFIPMSLQMASQGIVVSLGRSKQAVFFSLLRKAIINAPLTVILPIWMGTTGVFTAEAVSQLLGGLASSITMYFTVYRPYRRRPDKLREAAP